jgi:hypothetical protein
MECFKGFHPYCVDWKHIRLLTGGPTWFACHVCIEKRNKDIDEGDLTKEYLEIDSDNDDHGLAPQNAEAAGSRGEALRGSEDTSTDRVAAGGGAASAAPPPLLRPSAH